MRLQWIIDVSRSSLRHIRQGMPTPTIPSNSSVNQTGAGVPELLAVTGCAGVAPCRRA
jgi:hypothetical protein